MNKEIEIPEGYAARIEGNKVIFERKEGEDERIREVIESIVRVYGKTQGEWLAGYDMDTLVVHLRDAFAYLEKQKEQKSITTEETELNSIAFLEQMGYTCIPPGEEHQSAEWSEEEKMHLANAILAAEKEWGAESRTAKFLKSLRPHWKPSEEQPMPDSTQLIAEWEKEKAVLEQKDFRGDAERMAYNAFLDGFVKGIGYGRTK